MEQRRRTVLQWTATAKECLKKLPKKVRRGLLDKAAQLRDVDDPTSVHKALTGPLTGFYRIVFGRYRLIYTVKEQVLENDQVLIQVQIIFVAAGIRKERDKKDVYRVAKRLVEFGLVEIERDQPEE